MQPKIVLFLQIIHQEIQLEAGIYILAIYPPPPQGNFFVQMKNREEFEHEKRKGKGGKRRKKKREKEKRGKGKNRMKRDMFR